MTNPCLALESVSYVLPDGRTLFSDLSEQFDQRPVGLVGRNGAGKTVLARILAGQLQPTSGRCVRIGEVHYLAQQVTPSADGSVASLAGVQDTLTALARIEAGSTAPEDFDVVGDRWDIRQRLVQELERNGLDHLDVEAPVSSLSGGEAMRLALIGALLSDVDFLILDEPSNHLDRPNRLALIEQLQRWSRGLLVISHDRQLLETMERTVELSSLGMRSYGGNFTFYARSKAQERQNALQQLEQLKLERRREEHAMRGQRERQERRQARGSKHGKEANQANILLGRQKDRSEGSAGRLNLLRTVNREQLAQRVREAAKHIEDDAPISLHVPPTFQAAQRRLMDLEAVELPFVPAFGRHVHFSLSGQQRVGVVGPNGCGKSTLLKVMAGLLEPVVGTRKAEPKIDYLDQHLANLDPERSTLEQMRVANPVATEGDLRMRLAQLGLDAQNIMAPSGSLSGGERLKAALACVLYADPPPQLVLLDEPSNHLDLPSAQALEIMLRSYHGGLVVVSHDDEFMNNLELTHRLRIADQGWQLEPW